MLKDAFYIKFDAPVRGSGEVTFDRATEFDWCGCTIDDVKSGRQS
jgi:hypothetical protein